MAEKITFTSANPAFVDFPTWSARQIADLRLASQFEAADQMQAVIDAKKEAEEAGDWSMIAVEGNVYTVSDSTSPTTPEFEILWAQWIDAYDVTITVDPV